jgi:hypothetical protein
VAKRCCTGSDPGESPREACAILPADGEDRAQLDHDVEDLALLVVQAEEIGDDDQVAGGRDRQELGEPLDHSKQERVEQGVGIHRAVV